MSVFFDGFHFLMWVGVHFFRWLLSEMMFFVTMQTCFILGLGGCSFLIAFQSAIFLVLIGNNTERFSCYDEICVIMGWVGWGGISTNALLVLYWGRMWNVVVAFKNNVARHACDMCVVGVGWGGGVGRDNYKRFSCIYIRRMWNAVVAFRNNVARHARDMCGIGVGWGGGVGRDNYERWDVKWVPKPISGRDKGGEVNGLLWRYVYHWWLRSTFTSVHERRQKIYKRWAEEKTWKSALLRSEPNDSQS